MKLYELRYLVSPYGSVYDLLKKKWLKKHVQSSGYLQVFMSGKLKYLHRVVYESYFGQIHPFEIDHINGDKFDNSIFNLHRVTHKENMKRYLDGNRHKTHTKEFYSKMGKLSAKKRWQRAA